MTDVFTASDHHRVIEEVINYRNRMDSFVSSFITIPPVNLLKKKHLEFRRECLNRLMKSPAGNDINVIWELERHIFLFYQLLEDSYSQVFQCHHRYKEHLNVPLPAERSHAKKKV